MDSIFLQCVLSLKNASIYLEDLRKKKRFRRNQIVKEVGILRNHLEHLAEVKLWLRINGALLSKHHQSYFASCSMLICALSKKLFKFSEAVDRFSEQDNYASDSYDEDFDNTSSDSDSDSEPCCDKQIQ